MRSDSGPALRMVGLLRPAAFGVVQVLVSVTAHHVSTRFSPVTLGMGLGLVGATWGIVQVLAVAAPFTLGRGAGSGFGPAVAALSGAMWPAAIAVVVWGAGLVVVGSSLVADPELAAISTPVSGTFLGAAAVTSLAAAVWVVALAGRAGARLRSPGWAWGAVAVGMLAATAAGFFHWGARLFG